MKTELNIKPMLSGVLLMLLAEFVLAALFAAFLNAGILPLSGGKVLGVIGVFLACLAGGWVISRGLSGLRLPFALMTAGVLLLLTFVLRGLIFGTVGEGVLLTVLAGFLGAAIGAGFGAGKSGRRRKR